MMIEGLRFVEREVLIPRPDLGLGVYDKKKVRILQYHTVSNEWADVPLEIEE